MSELSFYSIDSFLGWLKGTAFPAAPGTVYLALYNGDPDQNGTEVTTLVNASGRQAITFGSIVHHQITTTALIDFGNAASATTVSWLAVFDAASGGNCLTRRALAAPVAIASGQDAKVNVGDLTIQLTELDDRLTVGGGGGTSALAVDGTSTLGAYSEFTTSPTATLTTTKAGDLIVAQVFTAHISSNGTYCTVTGVSGGGLTWSKRQGADYTDATNNYDSTVEVWTAVAPGALSNVVITATLSAQARYAGINAFGISGINTSSPYDSNASVPASGHDNSAGSSVPGATISTTNAHDFILGVFYNSGGYGNSLQSGFTALFQNTSALIQYKVVSSPQSNLSVNQGTSIPSWGAVVDAYCGT
jgi:hypothetical protein